MDLGNSTDSKILLDCCRICVSICDARNCIHEGSDHESSLSLHCMLAKLFPAIFSLEQIQHDRSMNWPTSICKECKCKVINAYDLYAQCESSNYLLSQQPLTVISDGVANEEYFQNKPSEDVPLITEEVFNVKLVKHDHDRIRPSTISGDNNCNTCVVHGTYATDVDLSDQQQLDTSGNGVANATKEENFAYVPLEEVPPLTYPNPAEVQSPVEQIEADKVPETTRASKRITSRKHQSVTGIVTRRKRKQVIAEEANCSEEHKEVKDTNVEKLPKPQTDDGHHLGEKSKENFNLQFGSHKTSRRRSSKVKSNKLKEATGLETKIDSPKTSHADGEELETKIDLYHCLFCDAPTYTSPMKLTEHLKEMHPDQIRHCEQCPKVFVTQTSFEQHQYCHATGRSYFCTFCDKGFQTEKLRKSHVRTHTHRLDFLCSHCGKEFNNKSNLRQHVIGHSGDKPWACNLCPCRFSTKGGLTIHQNTHTKVKAFSCDICGSQFNKHYSLIKHKLIHTGERPFGCEVCGMRFATSYMVKRHMRTHTGEKPFKCTYCERSFAQSNDMVKHMKIHVGNNPYQCDRCDVSFRLLTDLRNHYKEHYQTGEPGPSSSPEQSGGIRFTSIDILQLRYKKEKGTLGIEHRESAGAELKEVTKFDL